jgi:hypothetical protein
MIDNTAAIQQSRRELKKLILEQVIPAREKLDNLLNEEAKRICPFKIEDVITLDNGKKGVIKEIKYFSLDYEFRNEIDNEFSNFIQGLDDIGYLYAYIVDDKKFSITWSISGLRLKKNGDVGQVTFSNLSPDRYLVDVAGKRISAKPLKDLVGIDSFLTNFSEID